MHKYSLCAYENRTENVIGLKLLCLSVNRHNPGVALFLYSDHFPQSLRKWVQSETQNVTLVELSSGRPMTWDVKPQILLDMLARGHRRVLWIDSDIIVTQNISKFLDAIPTGTLGVGEEQGSFDPRRVSCLGMEVGREFSSKVNSCLICVGEEHRALLERWSNIMEGEFFQKLQALPGELRPAYIGSDQDVLSGLLCSKAPEGFSDLPTQFFSVNEVITHAAAAYRIRARLRRCMRPLVPFVHTNGHKPWYSLDDQHRRLEMLGVELSLYNHAARPYANALSQGELHWISPRSLAARVCNLLVLGNPHLRGAFPMILSDVARAWLRARVRL
ncbi:MAG: hypothetical protein O3C43_21925 [Verrucomicrobia bacterium]|nr:hypothetical protein [Verrucomicrobiota bacterium]MDA1069154.1 hypothetical protein [Verrucomicrobiota bacterium]